MQLIEMITSGGHVQMLYANAATKEEASEWLEFRVPSPTRANQRLGVEFDRPALIACAN